MQEKILKEINEYKLTDIQCFDVRDKNSFTNYVIIATGSSSRTIDGAQERLNKHLKQEGVDNITLDGEANSGWVILDIPGVIVHFFTPEVRNNYKLEELFDYSLIKKDVENGKD